MGKRNAFLPSLCWKRVLSESWPAATTTTNAMTRCSGHLQKWSPRPFMSSPMQEGNVSSTDKTSFQKPQTGSWEWILGKHVYFPDYIRQTTVHPDMLILSDHVGTGCALGRTLDGGSGEDACLIPGPLQKWRLLGPLQPLKWAVQVFVWTFVLDFLLF